MHYGLNADVIDVRLLAEDWQEALSEAEFELEAERDGLLDRLDAVRASCASSPFPRLLTALRQSVIPANDWGDDMWDERERELEAEHCEHYELLGKELGCDTPRELQSFGNDYEPTLVAEWHFEAYAEELADDIGMTDNRDHWPLTYIDWEAAAEALKQDYMAVDFDGYAYYIRSW